MGPSSQEVKLKRDQVCLEDLGCNSGALIAQGTELTRGAVETKVLGSAEQ